MTDRRRTAEEDVLPVEEQIVCTVAEAYQHTITKERIMGGEVDAAYWKLVEFVRVKIRAAQAEARDAALRKAEEAVRAVIPSKTAALRWAIDVIRALREEPSDG